MKYQVPDEEKLGSLRIWNQVVTWVTIPISLELSAPAQPVSQIWSIFPWSILLIWYFSKKREMIILQQSIWKLTDNRSLTSTATYIRKKSRGIAWWFPLLVQFSCRRKACYFKSRFLQNNCSLGEVQARTDKDIYCVCILCSLKQEGMYCICHVQVWLTYGQLCISCCCLVFLKFIHLAIDQDFS